MAGKSKQHGDNPTILALQRQILEQQQELNILRPLCSDINPAALSATLPETPKEFTQNIANMIIAKGMCGLTPREILLECGINSDLNVLWINTLPTYKAVITRARDLAIVYFHKKIRQAVDARDWKLPYQQALTMIDRLYQDENTGVDAGDASKLIILDPEY